MTLITTVGEWEGLPVNQVINSETGEMEIKTIPGPGFIKVNVTLAKSNKNNKWELVYPDNYRRLVNKALKQDGKKELSAEDFREKFWTDGTTTFNINRAKMLNKRGIVTDVNRDTMVKNGIPFMVGTNGISNNSKGVLQTDPTIKNTGGVFPLPLPLPPPPVGPTVAESTTRTRTRTKTTLRYPLETPDSPFDYDYISIQAYDYKPSGLGTGNEQFKIDKNIMNDEGTDYGTSYETVILPMQPSLSETNAVNWSDDELNPVQAMLGKTAMNLIDDSSKGDWTAIANELKDLYGTAMGLMKEPTTKQFIQAYFAGQAIGANVVGRTHGMVINPNLELLFNGPNLRSFNFNFKLTPRSKLEAERCKEIIRAFKRNMAVSRTAGNLFLMSPRIFKLKYIFKGDGDHPYLNKFKPCALTNFAVDYTPDGSYSTFNNGSMTQFALNMSFSEVMPIYAEDNPKDDTKTMGY